MRELETDSLKSKVILEATVLPSKKFGIFNHVDISVRGGHLVPVLVSFSHAPEEVS